MQMNPVEDIFRVFIAHLMEDTEYWPVGWKMCLRGLLIEWRSNWGKQEDRIKNQMRVE